MLALSSEVFSLGGGVAVGFRLAEEVEGWSEAKAWVRRNAVHEASRRSVAEGLDHSGTLEAEKRHAGWGGWHRSVSGVVVSARSADPNESRQASFTCYKATRWDVFDGKQQVW